MSTENNSNTITICSTVIKVTIHPTDLFERLHKRIVREASENPSGRFGPDPFRYVDSAELKNHIVGRENLD